MADFNFGGFPFGFGPFGGARGVGGGDIVVGGGFGAGPFGDLFGINAILHWVTNTSVYAGFDGPQIVVTWSLPTGDIDRLRIYRKEEEYPQSITDADAVLVYNEAGAGITTVAFADTTLNASKTGADPVAGTWYYYRIFTELEKPFDVNGGESIDPTFDPTGGSEGFALCYDPTNFVSHVWDVLMPDVWRSLDGRTSQRSLALYTDTTTDERVTLVTQGNEGFGERFVRILSLLLNKVFVHAAEIDRFWDFWNFRADEIAHVSWLLQGRVDHSQSRRQWRRELQDAVYKHARKGRYQWLQLLAEQEARRNIPPDVSVEMWNRVHYAWNPQDPATINGGPIMDDFNNSEQSDDLWTYTWNPSPESPYNERGWRLYFNFRAAVAIWAGNVLDLENRERLMDELDYFKPRTVTVELWENETFTARRT